MTSDMIYETLRRQYMSGQWKEHDRENLLFSPFGETAVSFRCLLYLLRHEEGVEPSKMAERVHILRQSATGVADQLAAKGYIERHVHPSDRRKILLKITSQGQAVTEQMLTCFREYHDRISACFTQEELDQYFQMRRRVNEARDQAIQEILARREAESAREDPS